jgi:hypothetical protein
LKFILQLEFIKVHIGVQKCASFAIFDCMQMPLHTIIEIQMGVTGVQEKGYKLMETQSQYFSTKILSGFSLQNCSRFYLYLSIYLCCKCF